MWILWKNTIKWLFLKEFCFRETKLLRTQCGIFTQYLPSLASVKQFSFSSTKNWKVWPELWLACLFCYGQIKIGWGISNQTVSIAWYPPSEICTTWCISTNEHTQNESIGYNNESIFLRQTQMLMVFSPWYWCWPTLTRNNKGLLGDETKKCIT